MTSHCQILILALAAAPFARAGQLAGKVTASDSGAALHSVSVFAYPLSPAEKQPLTYKAETGADGAFVFTAIPDGNYKLCAGHRGYYLDPCLWSQPFAATVRGAATVDLALDPGTPIAVRLSDVAGVVPEEESKLGGPLVAITLADKNKRTIPMPRVAAAGPTHEFAMVVPVDAAFKLNIASGKYLLADAAGSPIDERGYSLDVKGVRPQPPDPNKAAPFFRRGPQVVYGTLAAFQIRGLVK